MQIEITIYDAAGEVVSYDVCEAQTATEAEVNEMVALIDGGAPAYLAAMLVKQEAR